MITRSRSLFYAFSAASLTFLAVPSEPVEAGGIHVKLPKVKIHRPDLPKPPKLPKLRDLDPTKITRKLEPSQVREARKKAENSGKKFVKATGRYGSRQLRNTRDTVKETASLVAKGKISKAADRATTGSFKKQEEIVFRYSQESKIANAGMNAAANYFGGPLGGAAYAAWQKCRSANGLGCATKSFAKDYAISVAGGAITQSFNGAPNTSFNNASEVAARGAVGAGTSVLKGGKAEDGLISGVISGANDVYGPQYYDPDITSRVVVGGITATATGGSFYDGVETSFVSEVTNDYLQRNVLLSSGEPISEASPDEPLEGSRDLASEQQSEGEIPLLAYNDNTRLSDQAEYEAGEQTISRAQRNAAAAIPVLRDMALEEAQNMIPPDPRNTSKMKDWTKEKVQRGMEAERIGETLINDTADVTNVGMDKYGRAADAALHTNRETGPAKQNESKEAFNNTSNGKPGTTALPQTEKRKPFEFHLVPEEGLKPR